MTLTRLPYRSDEQEALLSVASAFSRMWPGWDRFLVGWCAAFHLLCAFTLAFAPYDQILSRGTQPVLELASRYVWAVLFVVAGVAAASLLSRPRSWVQVFTWLTVFPLGVAWVLSFALAVINGGGNALGVVVWPFLYVPWGVAAIRLGLGKR